MRTALVILFAALLLAGLSACGGGGGGGGEGTEADALDTGAGDGDVAIDAGWPDAPALGAIPVEAGEVAVKEADWVGSGKTLRETCAAALQLAIAVNWTLYADIGAIGNDTYKERVAAVRKSADLLARNGAALAAQVAAYEQAAALRDAHVPGSELVTFSARDQSVLAGLKAVADAAIAQAETVSDAIKPMEEAADARNRELVDTALAACRDGAAFSLVAAGRLLVAGDASKAAQDAAALAGVDVAAADVKAVISDEGVTVGTGAVAEGQPDTVPLSTDQAVPGLLILRGDEVNGPMSRRVVSGSFPDPAAVAGLLLSVAFPDWISADVQTSPVAGGTACWLPANAATADCADSKSGLFPEGAFYDPDTGEYFVSHGLSPDVAKVIAAGVNYTDLALTLPEIPHDFQMVVDSVSPESGPPGTVVTLTGSGFGTDPSKMTVHVSGGWLYHLPVSSLTDRQITFVFPTGPNSDGGPWCHFRGFQDCAMWITREGVDANAKYFQVNSLPGCPPVLYYKPNPPIASPGDEVSIYGIGFSPVAEKNIVYINGLEVPAVRYEPDELLQFDGFGTIWFVVPKEASSGEVKVKRLDGIPGWSPQILEIEIRPATVPVLNAGQEGDGLFVAAYATDLGAPSKKVYSQPHTWILGGQNLLQLRMATGGSVPGLLNVDITTKLGKATVGAPVTADDRIFVTAPADIIAGLVPGDQVTMIVRGNELFNWKERVSAPLVLPVKDVLYHGMYRVFHSNLPELDAPAWENPALLARGDWLFLLPQEQNPETIVLSGVVNETVAFNQTQSTAEGEKLVLAVAGRAFHLTTPGALTIKNQKTGKTVTAEVRDEGAPGSATLSTQLAAEQGMHFGCGGVIVDIPPGALPVDEETGKAYTVSCSHAALEGTLLLQQTTGGTYKTSVQFSPEPAKLLKQISFSIPYSDESRTTKPEVGLLDSATGCYAQLPTELDEPNKKAILHLPEGSYGGGQQPRLGEAPEDGQSFRVGFYVPPVWLTKLAINRITKEMAAFSWKTKKGQLIDEKRKLTVNYVTEPGKSGYVSDSFAMDVMMAMDKTFDRLSGDDWMEPGGITSDWVAIYIADLGPANGKKGKTTSGVFGQPDVTINSNLETGKPLNTTCAHEMCHVFQRQVTTNITLQWVDEASANWAAVATFGDQADVTGDVAGSSEFPNKTFPTSFGGGFDPDEAYAAGAWAIWLDMQQGGVWGQMYKHMGYDPSYWWDSYGAIKAETGLNMTEMTHQFARDYWGQTYPAIRDMSINQKTVKYLKDQGTLITESRPTYSSNRVDIQIADDAVANLVGADVVARTTGLEAARYVYILTDSVLCGTPPGTTQEIAELSSLKTAMLLPKHQSSVKCYRAIFINASGVAASTITLQLVSPRINSVSPKTGSNNGGYAVSITGAGFGTEKGEVKIGGFPQYVSEWRDTSITFTMFNAGTWMGYRDVVVTTKEYANSNTAGFDFLD